jgi:putative transposase
VGFCDTPGSAWDVAVSNSDAYVADGAAGLRMISVANPVNPVKFEFNFRDAKEYWGFKDFMNVEKTQVTNAINLSFFMVNISRRLLRDFRCHQPEANVLDLKTFFLSRRYVTEVIKILGEKPDTILIQDVFDKIAKLGAIH